MVSFLAETKSFVFNIVFPGIFAYLNYCTPRKRDEILTILLDSLKKLALRGYDSVGLGLDSTDGELFTLLKHPGELEDFEDQVQNIGDKDKVFHDHVGIAHTRWATHGAPSVHNTHPIASDAEAEFIVVHNGMLTNYRQLKLEMLEQDPYLQFSSETDTEIVAKYAKIIYDLHGGKEGISFREIVEQICLKLVREKAP